jgi:Ca2+-binding EF-hand superfamily protein
MLKRISVYAAVIAAGGLLYLPIIANAKEGGQRGPAFEKIDADGDGQITKAELEAMGVARFEKVDADGDGFITQAEVEIQQSDRAAKRAARMMERLDADEDGRISLAEMQKSPRANKMFDRVDADGDGVITKAEFDDMKERRQGRRKP